MPAPFAGPTMTLDNMRSHGVSMVEASYHCGRRAIVELSALPGAIEVPALRFRLASEFASELPPQCCGGLFEN
jgi:hypothetical protein